MAVLPARSQTSESFLVGGDQNNYYPVTFLDGGWASSVATKLEIGRSDVHANGATPIQWYGTMISTFTYHCTAWGNGSSFINADIRQQTSYKAFIGGWADASGNNGTQRIIIWMRGNTVYHYTSSHTVSPVIYDGVQNALPFAEPGGASHTTKTEPDFYVNINGLSYQNNAYFHGDGNNYFLGNVKIGNIHSPNDYKLSVDGTIGARKVKVTQAAWPDYVFASSYSLMPLAQLESFINQHQHLPEIPSAAEVEMNGLDVGDNQAKLLQKIEELTLYVIELNKKLEAQDKKIEVLTQSSK